jgi:aminopeptidase N/puromycin-sensitive aminopeptidase
MKTPQTGNKGAAQCELLTKKEDTFTVPGCPAWVLANAGGNGYYRTSYQPAVVSALARDAETALTPVERILLLTDTWAGVRAGRQPVGDYLTVAEGMQSERTEAVLTLLFNNLNFAGKYLVTESDRSTYQAWLRDWLTPIAKEVSWTAKPGESAIQASLRANLLQVMGGPARDPAARAEARRLTDQWLQDPASVESALAGSALTVSVEDGDSALYDKLLAGSKNAKSPELYYTYLFSLAGFGDPQLLLRTLNYAISPDVRSQDTLGLVGAVMANPAGEKLTWDFVRSRWPDMEKAGGPFASAAVVNYAGRFCDAQMREQVNDFFSAHKVAAAERTFKQAMERINACIDLKSQQSNQLTTWLGTHTGGAAAGSSVR